MPTITVGGGDIFVDNANVGSVYTSPIAVNGNIVPHPPPAGESFLTWTGDTGALDNPAAQLTGFTLGATDVTVTASNSDTAAPIDTTNFAVLDGKLDDIYVDTQAMRAGSA